MNDNKALEALERLYKSHAENNFAPFPTRSDLDTIRLALTELAEIKRRAEEQRKAYQDVNNELEKLPWTSHNADNVSENITAINIIDYIIKGETK